MNIYINNIKATADDLKALFTNIYLQDDYIKDITKDGGNIYIYTI